jgi:hypothetical protein
MSSKSVRPLSGERLANVLGGHGSLNHRAFLAIADAPEPVAINGEVNRVRDFGS